ncbi:hypothetical protein [Candidatus Methanomassiliicoccus intestinalis]|jgi:hypothetical protein|uniref:Uncharacterized protein n=1 Tax=Candidatus Methanomassiliicoccus intestinalis TaxID=1406512 RepID=A0A8J8TEL7_9ARCH|nr:MAG: hypothetical protein A3207_07935 [Candidatus Methanomassiliicoccus intestinalis]
MKKKDVLLVLVVILIPIVILGAVAVAGADNIKDSITFEGTEGCTITNVDGNIINGSVEKVHVNSDYTFTITVNEGYSGAPILHVDDSSVPLKATSSGSNKYTYTVHIDEDPIVIKITGIEKA